MHKRTQGSRSIFTLGWFASAVFIASVFSGCGGGEDPRAELIQQLVWNVSKVTSDPAAFKNLFAAGATVPEADRERYAEVSLNALEASIEFSGDTATFTVVVEERDVETPLTNDMPWTAVLEGGAWKLESAPLPQGGPSSGDGG